MSSLLSFYKALLLLPQNDVGNVERPSSSCVFSVMVTVLVASLITFAVVFVSDGDIKRGSNSRTKKNILNQQRPDGKQLLLSREKIDLVTKRQWKDVLTWIVFHPEELTALDRNGQSILHHVCLFRAPAEIIQMILWQAAELAAVPNPDGEVPLHWAIRLSSPNEQIETLLAACPQTGTCAKDKEGSTPLTLLWDRHREHILETWWTDRSQIKSLHAWKRIMLFFPCPHQYNSLDEEDGTEDSTSQSHPDNRDEGCDYHKHDKHAPHETVLHVASRSPCPPGLFSILLQVYQEDVLKRDGRGRLPLHCACSDAYANRSSDVISKVQALLRERPTTASCRDEEGRLPFYVALEAGISWDEGLRDLLKCHPKSLIGRDPRTNLDPFLLAATVDKCDARFFKNGPSTMSDDENYSIERSSRNSVDTIYRLFRMDPSRIV